MVEILTEEQRTDIDAIIGDADEFIEHFSTVLMDPAFHGVFAALIAARMLELHPKSFRSEKRKLLT